MKKIRILSSSLIVAAMLMGAGYAAWTDTLSLTNTVETGEFNVEFDGNTFATYASPLVSSRCYVSGNDSHTIQLDLSNLYSNSCASFKVKGINTGTIPAKLDNITVDFSGDRELLEYLTYETNIVVVNSNNGNTTLNTINLDGNLADLANDINNNTIIKDIQLSPNSNGRFYMGGFNDSNTDSYFVIKFGKAPNSMITKKNLKFTININFKQFNQ